MDAAQVEVDPNLKAIIAPHAGYYYCGSCAAHAYKKIDPRSGIKRIFIMGPSHHVHFDNCVLSPATVYETPLGDLTVDERTVKELKETGLFSTMPMRVDEEEHSVEMQLPFIAKQFQDKLEEVTIVPMLVGSLNRSQEKVYGKLMSGYFADEENFFVISSDFCHWGERFGYTYYDDSHDKIHESIEALDGMGMRAIESMEGERFSRYLRQYKNTICGRHSIAVMMDAANEVVGGKAGDGGKIEKFDFSFLNYKQSSQVVDFDDSSVSYASGGMTAVMG